VVMSALSRQLEGFASRSHGATGGRVPEPGALTLSSRLGGSLALRETADGAQSRASSAPPKTPGPRVSNVGAGLETGIRPTKARGGSLGGHLDKVASLVAARVKKPVDDVAMHCLGPAGVNSPAHGDVATCQAPMTTSLRFSGGQLGQRLDAAAGTTLGTSTSSRDAAAPASAMPTSRRLSGCFPRQDNDNSGPASGAAAPTRRRLSGVLAGVERDTSVSGQVVGSHAAGFGLLARGQTLVEAFEKKAKVGHTPEASLAPGDDGFQRDRLAGWMELAAQNAPKALGRSKTVAGGLQDLYVHAVRDYLTECSRTDEASCCGLMNLVVAAVHGGCEGTIVTARTVAGETNVVRLLLHPKHPALRQGTLGTGVRICVRGFRQVGESRKGLGPLLLPLEVARVD